MKILKKMLIGFLCGISMSVISPIKANAEWHHDSKGWWYSNEKCDYFSGWNLIDGKWYYFNSDNIFEKSYLVQNSVVDGYTVGADGAWIENIPAIKAVPTIANESDFDFDSTTGRIIKYKGTLTGYNNSIIIPDTINGVKVKIIGANAFFRHSELVDIIIPNGITTIAGGAFVQCFNLRHVIIPNTVTAIYFRAFSVNQNLKNVVVPNSVTTMGEYVFDGCPKMNTLTIPKTLSITDEKLIGGYYLGKTKIVRV